MKDLKKIGIWILSISVGVIVFMLLYLFQSVYSTFETLPTRLRKKYEIRKDLKQMPWRAHIALITITIFTLLVSGMPWWGIVLSPLAVVFAYFWVPELDYSLKRVQEIVGEINENSSPEIDWRQYPFAKKIGARRR